MFLSASHGASVILLPNGVCNNVGSAHVKCRLRVAADAVNNFLRILINGGSIRDLKIAAAVFSNSTVI